MSCPRRVIEQVVKLVKCLMWEQGCIYWTSASDCVCRYGHRSTVLQKVCASTGSADKIRSLPMCDAIRCDCGYLRWKKSTVVRHMRWHFPYLLSDASETSNTESRKAWSCGAAQEVCKTHAIAVTASQVLGIVRQERPLQATRCK